MELYLILLILTTLAVNGQEEPRKTRERKKWNSVCCQGEKYSYRGYSDEHFLESCDVEPKTDNLSFQDSLWLAYDCHVRTWLNGTELTKQTFVTWISQLPQSNQSKFWSVLPSQDRNNVETAEDEITKSQNIKSYYLEYLKTVVKICLSEYENGDSNNKKAVEAAVWEKLTFSLKNCSFGPVPSFLSQYTGGHETYENCKIEFSNVLGNETYRKYRTKALAFCLSPSKRWSVNELEKEDLDFQTTVYSMMPNFWSKSTKKLIIKNILRKLSSEDSNSPNEKDIIRKLWVEIHEKLSSFQNERGNSTSGTNVVQILRNLHFGAEINKLMFFEKLELCSPRTQLI